MCFRDSIGVSISACHADDPGSIPGRGVLFTGVRATDGFFDGHTAVAVAVIAQLGERQTEDLEVLGSIPGFGNFRLFYIISVVVSNSTYGRIVKTPRPGIEPGSSA